MAEVIGGLFGITPEQLQAQRYAALQSEALQFAKLDPMQQATMGIYSGSRRFADALGGLMGGQDPELERITNRQSLLKDLDATNPESLKGAAARALQSGDYPAAQEFLARARDIETSALDSNVKLSTIYKNMKEKAGSDPIQQLLRSGKFTPASIAAYEQSGEIKTLEPLDKEFQPKVVETQEGVFLVDPRTGQEIARIGSPVKRGTEVKVGLPPQPKAEQEARGKLLVEQFKGVSEQARVAARSLPALEAQMSVLDKGFDTGFGTDAIAAGAKVLSALGVEDATKFATNSQSFVAMASQAVLTRQLEQKGPQTEADAQRITQTGAQLGNTKEANRFLISVAKAQFKRDIAQRSFYDKWFKANKTYDGAEDAWFDGEGGKSLFDMPELRQYAQTRSTAAAIPTGGTTAPAASNLSPQDQQALAWANANPNDPRAAQIKARLGK